ncbi:MAG: hypothetical protein VKN33_00570 [Candidatus Sericytochromatia bacterium]|nr:hypothetical protein [Candidatus Sericytochromatia bacterium]
MLDPAALLGLPLGEAQALVHATEETLLPLVRTQASRKYDSLISCENSQLRVLRVERTELGLILAVAPQLGDVLAIEARSC